MTGLGKIGRLFAIVGPSGAGKDTLIAGAVARDPALHWARRVITRPEQAGGEPFRGVDAARFAAMAQAGEFRLSWQAHGLSYGIPAAEFLPLQAGRTVLFNGSRAALGLALQAFPGLRIIRISAPSRVLADRLAARGRESRDEIEARLRRQSYDLPEDWPVVDVVNDATPQEGIARLLSVLGPVSA